MIEDIRRDIRPKIDFEKKEEDTIIHVFQNETLRPIMKMQHQHFVIMAMKHMPKITSINEDLDRRLFCQQFLNKNPLVTNLLTGMVVGLFTEDEMKFYIENAGEVSKRIKEMLIVRIADGTGSGLPMVRPNFIF